MQSASPPSALITCGGKWVGSLLGLREAFSTAGNPGIHRLYVADAAGVTAASYFADQSFRVPLINSSDYIDSLLDICRGFNVKSLVPLIDLDVARIAPHLDSFESAGTRVAAPRYEVASLCIDKVRFADFCSRHSLSHVPLLGASDVFFTSGPIAVKPRTGFGSRGFMRVESGRQASELLATDPELIAQPFIDSSEVSLDGYINSNGECTILVPRLREKVVGGEAQQSTTITHESVWDLGLRTVQALAEYGYRGPINIQAFLSATPMLIEVNPRLGSCSVLSNRATGGRLFWSIAAEASGMSVGGSPDDYEVGLSVHRFVGDVYVRDQVPFASVPDVQKL